MDEVRQEIEKVQDSQLDYEPAATDREQLNKIFADFNRVAYA